MAKSEKELQELKEKAEGLSKELNSLTEEELSEVAGGTKASFCPLCSGAKSIGGKQCPRCMGAGVVFIR